MMCHYTYYIQFEFTLKFSIQSFVKGGFGGRDSWVMAVRMITST